MKKQTKLNIIFIVLSAVILISTLCFTHVYTKYQIMKEIQKYEVTTTKQEVTTFKNNN